MDLAMWLNHILLWALVIGLGFLLLGTLRAQGLMSWRLAQLESTTPSRIGRSGFGNTGASSSTMVRRSRCRTLRRTNKLIRNVKHKLDTAA